jgi:hypothetical protein
VDGEKAARTMKFEVSHRVGEKEGVKARE